ncbi:MAG: UDP-N-acetylmuramoyl-L-alanyl-D-glutamate--2,6-diaminopimelate ligase, partial [Kiritimatiellae bacterium]|nr:UDP-N-acetylmuramoyl-L-alanyl-D-glutamate--2,6-diaminopimelate ligase [Kiritimatiellia bacterium]
GMLTTVQYEIGQRSIPAVRTTPEAPALHDLLAQMQKVGCRSAVMEVSSHSIVQKRVAGVDFDVAVFTNLTRDHLDYHKTMEQYFDAKAELFHDLRQGENPAVAVINIDDEWGRKLVADPSVAVKVVTYGVADNADVRASNISVTPEGCSFTVDTAEGSVELKIKLLGRFNVSNALAALATGLCLGIDLDSLARSLSHAECAAGRLEVVQDSGRKAQVFVDYAHTDDALKNVLQTLREITKGKLFVVFGCGGDRDRTKRPAMGKVAEELADYTILTSDNPRGEEPSVIIDEIAGGFMDASKYKVIEDRRDAIVHAVSLAEKGDVVLIAGKGHENFQVFKNKTVAFDDRQVVRDVMDGEG